MNKHNTFLSLMFGLAITSVSTDLSAQDRDRNDANRDRSENHASRSHDDNRDHNNNSSYNQGTDDRNHHNGYDNRDQRMTYNSRSDRDRDHYSYRGYERRDARNNHYNTYYRSSRPVIVHQYQQPRYVYYRDYNVYYDCRQSVYIYRSGKQWNISSGVPMVMRHVNVRTIPRYHVNYYDDDFPRYLENNRPSYGPQCDGW
jgi:hypothetical protein